MRDASWRTVPPRLQAPEQPVRGALGEAGGGGDLADPHRPLHPGQHLEHVEGPVHRLRRPRGPLPTVVGHVAHLTSVPVPVGHQYQPS